MTLPVKVDRPTFIVGPHRSGTTLLYGTLGRHPDLGYYNRQNRHTPDWPRLAALITRLGGRDDPMEAQNIWDRFRSHEDDSMTEADVTPEVKRWFRWNIATVLAARNATRFIAKYPRLSLRLPWIDAIFPIRSSFTCIVTGGLSCNRRHSGSRSARNVAVVGSV
jgi:hypothetical protein